MGRNTLGRSFSALHSPPSCKERTDRLIQSDNPGLNVTTLLFQESLAPWFSTMTALSGLKMTLSGLHRSPIISDLWVRPGINTLKPLLEDSGVQVWNLLLVHTSATKVWQHQQPLGTHRETFLGSYSRPTKL